MGEKVKGVLDIIMPQVVKTSEDISNVVTNVVEQVEEMLEGVGQELRSHVEDGIVALTDKLEATMDIVEDRAKELTKEVQAIKANPTPHVSQEPVQLGEHQVYEVGKVWDVMTRGRRGAKPSQPKARQDHPQGAGQGQQQKN